MERRDLLRALASATALIVLPNNKALAAWSRVAAGERSPNGLSDAHMGLVRAIADTIIPRTDTPSATDVGVDRFVDVIVTEQISDADRATGLAGLDAIDARAMSLGNDVFTNLSPEARAKVIESLETSGRDVEPAKTYWQLKGLIIHGYFTSEPVMKDVLKVQVMPGKFEGAAPITIKKRPSTTLTPPSEAGHAHG
jgi:hypothetical protein